MPGNRAFNFPTQATEVAAADIPYTPTVPGDWDGPPTEGQEAWDELAARVKALEGGGPGPETVISDTAASAGNVARRKTNGHVEKATGATQADSLGVVALYSAAVLLGASTSIYKNGSRLPVAGLPVGDLYRSNTGTAVLYSSLVVGEWTNYLGYSDGNGLDVNVQDGFQVT